MVRTAIRAIRFQIEGMLKKHKKLKLIIEIGNHDPVATIWLMEAFNMFYENEPRVSIDTTPRPFHCFTFGANFIGTHHGDKVKMNLLPIVFASDYATEWGETVYRTIHTGHIHNDNVTLIRFQHIAIHSSNNVILLVILQLDRISRWQTLLR